MTADKGADQTADPARQPSEAAPDQNAEVERARQMLQLVIDSIPQRVFWKDRDSVYLGCNRVFARDAGVDEPSRIVGRNDFELSWKATASLYRADDRLVMESGEPKVDFEEPQTRPGGQMIWLRTSKVPLRDTSGQVFGVLGTYEDITEKKVAEAKLRESERRYESLFANMQEGLAYCRMLFADGRPQDFIYLGVNDAFGRLTGLRGVEGKLVSEVIPGIRESDPELFAIYGRVALTGKPERFEIFIEAMKMWFSISVYSPEKEHFVAVFDVITERKEAEAERTRLSEVVNQAAEAVLMTDTSGDIVYVNPAFEKVSGYSRAEVMGRNPRLLKSGKQGPEFYREVWQTITHGLVWSGRLTNRRKDGTLSEEEATIFPVCDPGGRIVNYVAIKRDVTQELRLQEQLQQSQKMEAVGRLAGGVAHDFNNLLTVILGYGEMAMEGLPQDSPVRSMVGEMVTAGKRATEVTRQLLAFSRKQVVQPKVFDLNELVSSAERLLGRLIGEDIDLLAVRDPYLGRIEADPGQIEQVIMNLAVNARDAMPKGGRLTIETQNVDVGEIDTQRHLGVEPGRYVMLAVSDSGVGMDADAKAHAFEPFFTTKEKGKGTGLGLAMVYGIVKQAGGHIWLYSELGQGTTFKIYLPRVDMPPRALPSGRQAALVRRGTEVILLVEDEEPLRALMQKVLEAGGYRVLAAGNGEEGLELAASHEGRIDLMVTDVVMPGIGGRELATKIAVSRPGMQVMYVSGYTDNAIVRHGVLELGVRFLQKPFTPDALARRVREILDEEQRDQDS